MKSSVIQGFVVFLGCSQVAESEFLTPFCVEMHPFCIEVHFLTKDIEHRILVKKNRQCMFPGTSQLDRFMVAD
jgi:hypothetical protein